MFLTPDKNLPIDFILALIPCNAESFYVLSSSLILSSKPAAFQV